jgi:hypothetical protein
MMPDGRRLPVTTEAAGRLGVSVQTIDRGLLSPAAN